MEAMTIEELDLAMRARGRSPEGAGGRVEFPRKPELPPAERKYAFTETATATRCSSICSMAAPTAPFCLNRFSPR